MRVNQQERDVSITADHPDECYKGQTYKSLKAPAMKVLHVLKEGAIKGE